MSRNDAGPFVILGIDKDADLAGIESQFSARMELAKQSQINWTKDDLQWARGELLDPQKRSTADAQSLNADLASGDVRRLTRLYRVDSQLPSWEPMDPEPPAELPEASIDVGTVLAELPSLDIVLDLPSADQWLEQFAASSLDPWSPDVIGL